MVFEEELEENIQQDLEQEAYERKKISLKRLTIFVFLVDIVLAVYVVIQFIHYIESLINS